MLKEEISRDRGWQRVVPLFGAVRIKEDSASRCFTFSPISSSTQSGGAFRTRNCLLPRQVGLDDIGPSATANGARQGNRPSVFESQALILYLPLGEQAPVMASAGLNSGVLLATFDDLSTSQQ
jgi:hypothetical protein